MYQICVDIRSEVGCPPATSLSILTAYNQFDFQRQA